MSNETRRSTKNSSYRAKVPHKSQVVQPDSESRSEPMGKKGVVDRDGGRGCHLARSGTILSVQQVGMCRTEKEVV